MLVRPRLLTGRGAAALLAVLGGWSAVPRPTASQTLTVAPVAPLAGTILATVTPALTWDPGPAPPGTTTLSFRVRVARDSALRYLAVDTVVTNDTTLALRRALRPGRMYWQVEATASPSGQTATTGIVGPVTVPAWAVLTAYTDPAGTAIADSQPTLTWTSPGVAAPPGPFVYDIAIRRLAATTPDVVATGLGGTSFTPAQGLQRNAAYTWSLVVHAGADTTSVRTAGSFLVLDPSLPSATLLYQNFPNPFPAAGRDSTCLWFDIAVTGLVELTILDLRGIAVRRFVPGPDFPPILTAGRYGRNSAGGPTCDPRLTWDGRADDGRTVPAGVYLFRLKASGTVYFKRIVFLGKP